MTTRSRPLLTSTLAIALLAAAGLSTATSASAQIAGKYVGLTSQNQTIEITITEDGVGGFNFGGALVFWDATCKISGPGRSVGWGIGSSVPLTYPVFSYEFAGNALYESYRFKFVQNGTRINGLFIGRTPEFVDPSAANKRAQLCDSGTVQFSADWTAPAADGKATPLPAAGQAVQLR